ncbi:hypothetical protein NA78x_001399 [Anatilimnocola sp. NA78]|uniref:hypothetical protein n=1 Tax=Anatilimnocola sp. NA78 TaxID=3415683 RepID=UPI003CE48942
MTGSKRIALALGLFGVVVIGSGLIRFLSTPAGQNGLYFGLVMGGIVLAGVLLAGLNLVLAGRIVGGLGIALVLLWFGYDLYQDLAANFVIGSAEIRKFVVLGAGVAAAILIILPIKPSITAASSTKP